MNVIDITSRTVKTYTVQLQGGEVRPVPYSRAERRYRVQRVEVVKRDGNVHTITTRGHVLKKDGSDSANTASETFGGYHGPAPAWLEQIIKGLA